MATPDAPTAPDWRRVQREFPVNRELVWLNNCGIAPPPGPVTQAVKAHHDAYAARGVLGVPSEEAVHASACGRLARLLGVAAGELALIHNTAEGMTFVSQGLDLAPGDRILTLSDEYPSNVYPWQHWQQRGVALDFVPAGRDPGAFLAALTAALRPETRVVTLSAVHWCSGMPLPLEEAARLCAARGVLLVLDGAQGVGLVPLDLRALGVAAMACSAWKWLLGPLGVGVLYVRPDLLPRLRFPFKGTGSVVDDHVYLPYRDALKPGTARYVLSTPNFNDWVYFDASLAYLERLGFAAVRRRIQELAGHLAEGLRRRGFALAHDGPVTGIVAAARQGVASAAIVDGLRARGVVAAERLGHVRLAPHVYLSEEQIEETLRIVDELS